MGKSPDIPTFFFFNLGCPKNIVDAQRVVDRLVVAGFREALVAEEADLIVLTTCAFIQAAEQESVDEILRIGEAKNEGQVFAVLGCLVSREADKLAGLFPEVDIFIPAADMEKLPERLAREGLITGPNLSDLACQGEVIPKKLFTPPHLAYLKVADGCSNNCTFCLIPKLRGSLISRGKNEIISEALGLSEKGVRELVVVAQDTGVWGRDLNSDRKLCDLLEDISSVVNSEWIRLMYLHPAHINIEKLVRLLSEGMILPYLDIPIQHVSTRLLREMGRGYGRDYLERLFDRLRSRIDGLVIRTTVMVGFPGETSEEFNELIDFIERYRLDHVGVFGFSPEEGTRAYNFDGMIGQETIIKRREMITDIQMDISTEHLAKREGTVEKVLVDEILDSSQRPAEGVWGEGRFYGQAYQIDGVVFLSGKRVELGELVIVFFKQKTAYDMFGSVR
ncbi:30S ribosomal protein S12 methylthiotransferase RimO [bacterium]|nr:30S ribosomal protein S12 methylthiotransferase RimO [bacterium]